MKNFPSYVGDFRADMRVLLVCVFVHVLFCCAIFHIERGANEDYADLVSYRNASRNAAQVVLKQSRDCMAVMCEYADTNEERAAYLSHIARIDSILSSPRDSRHIVGADRYAYLDELEQLDYFADTIGETYEYTDYKDARARYELERQKYPAIRLKDFVKSLFS